MHRIATVSLFLLAICMNSSVKGQLSVNPNTYEDLKGIKVASSRTVSAKPTKLRFFTTVVASDSNEKLALERLLDLKASVTKKLQVLMITNIQYGPTYIPQWEDVAMSYSYFSKPGLKVPAEKAASVTACASIQFDSKIESSSRRKLSKASRLISPFK